MNPAPDPGSPADRGADRQALDRAGDTRHPAFLRVARPYARHRVARGLDGLWVAGLDRARATLADRPVLFASNHVAWWDALLLALLDEALGGTGWAVMDAVNLGKLPFLGWVGALPLDRSSPERSRECLRNSAALLDRPGRGVWIFPQGPPTSAPPAAAGSQGRYRGHARTQPGGRHRRMHRLRVSGAGPPGGARPLRSAAARGGGRRAGPAAGCRDGAAGGSGCD
ncbi:MAG: 1-acyl-sn-glycerol-3-phosphate acyltransferase [Actinomycetia bacterium]|nr:1-acyl-sn-glycerol-3-phosphate acyltransferase [Actinomycetes bacterium]